MVVRATTTDTGFPSPVLAPELALHEVEVDDPDGIVVDLDIDDEAEPIDALLVNDSFVILAEVDVDSICPEQPEDVDVTQRERAGICPRQAW